METKEIILKNGNKINIKSAIGIYDMISLCKEAADACVDYDTGGYTPEVKNAVIQIYIAHYYTDCQLPDDFEDMWTYVHDNGIADAVYSFSDKDQLTEIEMSIDKRIEHNLRIHENALLSEMRGAIDMFKNTAEKLGGVTNGMDMEQVEKFMGKINAMDELNEEKIVNAVIQAEKKPARKRTAKKKEE